MILHNNHKNYNIKLKAISHFRVRFWQYLSHIIFIDKTSAYKSIAEVLLLNVQFSLNTGLFN